jgi:hypothetical protein
MKGINQCIIFVVLPYKNAFSECTDETDTTSTRYISSDIYCTWHEVDQATGQKIDQVTG